MSRNLLAVLLMAVLGGMHMTGAGAELVLVQDGQAAATIVVAADAGDKVKVAAADLQAYLERMSGATLPLVTDETTPEGTLVLVGAGRLTADLGVEIPAGVTASRREEGFVISCSRDRLLLAGNSDGPYHGTEYAVYELLNRLGVRWFMPGEFGEVVPSRETVTFPEGTVRETPDFIMRDWWLHIKPELADQERRWKIRNKMNPDRNEFFHVPGDSSIRNVLQSDLVTTKPELFALNPDGTRNPHYPNLSNPDAVQMVADKVKQWFSEHPEATSYGFAPDDGMPRDYNPETLKLSVGLPEVQGRPGVAAELSVSDEWFGFVNKVIAEVHKEHPGVYISTNGYANRDIAPITVKPDPSTVVMFAAIWCCTLHGYDTEHCWQKTRQAQMLRKWAELCPNVWIYGYNYNMLVSGLTLLPEFTKLRQDLPLLKKWGIIGFMDETRNVWMESGIGSRYLRARLEWDTDVNVDALLDEFFSQWYGPAAEPMKAYYYALDRAVAEGSVHGHEDRCLPELYSADLLNGMRRQVTMAKAAADSEPYATRVKAEELIHDHLRAYMAMTDADLEGDFTEAAKQAAQMLSYRRQIHAISPFFCWPDEDGYHTGVWYWKITDRQRFYEDLADKTGGKTGELVALCPTETAFRTDPMDEGRYAGWFATEWPAGDWPRISTKRPFFAQGYRSSQGHSYVGDMWYRFRVDVPAHFAGRTIRLCVPQVAAEAWCWVNGQFMGHRPYKEPYERPASMEVDVTSALRPGQANVIAFRVNTSLAMSADAEGIYSRAFLYAVRGQ